MTQVLSDTTEEVLEIPPGKFPTVNYSPQTVQLLIENEDEHPLYYQVVQGGFDTTLPAERVSEGIEVFREFTTPLGSPVQEVSLGEEIDVHLKFRSLDNRHLFNIAFVDLLPAGLEAVPTSVRDKARGSWEPEYTDIREDRLVLFGKVGPEMKEYVYTVRAINKGTFTVPPMYGEAMYDRSIYGISPQKPLVVR